MPEFFAPPRVEVDINQQQVALRGGALFRKSSPPATRGSGILNMIRGAEIICKELYAQGRFQGVIGMGGAQGTDIGCSAMRSLPVGVPRLMVSTVASAGPPSALCRDERHCHDAFGLPIFKG